MISAFLPALLLFLLRFCDPADLHSIHLTQSLGDAKYRYHGQVKEHVVSNITLKSFLSLLTPSRSSSKDNQEPEVPPTSGGRSTGPGSHFPKQEEGSVADTTGLQGNTGGYVQGMSFRLTTYSLHVSITHTVFL